jgi:hypothetical protein
MKEGSLIIILIFLLIFQLVFDVLHSLSKPTKCDVDKRIEFMKVCLNKIDLIHKPQNIDATNIISQCEETSQNLHCTY